MKKQELKTEKKQMTFKKVTVLELNELRKINGGRKLKDGGGETVLGEITAH